MMTELPPGSNPRVPPEIDAAIAAWMGAHGWKVGPAGWGMDPETGFNVWEEYEPTGERSRALWVAESMVRGLSAEQLVQVLNSEDMAAELRISFKVRIEERGDEYRVSIVPRRSGEWKKQE
jgi:hypothetical protein